ncbi:MAG: B12-binding domain-containing radical SAM protein [Microvirga sp.]|nr:radical SAM protein [Beijerinckiaceae bacterium]
MASGANGRKTFRLILIKPSHYDDDGYVIQWLRSPIPANSLACLYGLALDAQARDVLAPDHTLDVEAIDETNARVRPDRIAKRIAEAGRGMVMLVGVQSNQFPRALDIAKPLRQAGVTVGIGGFHVSGTLAMLPSIDPAVQQALDIGCFMYAGEAEEGRLDLILKDAVNGRLAPIYNFMKELPGIEHVPTPHLPASVIKRTYGANASFDAGRGCPFQCSFCTIINVQGRKSRRRSPDDVERIVRDNAAQGIFHFFITDDNFARNKDWEPIFDRLIHLREVEKIKIRLIIQVDTLCHRLPNFIEKAARAGVKRVFIGLENISPDNLVAAKKKQNKITEYRKMLLAWKNVGVITYAGYILGFPNDTPERIRRDIEVIKKELPVDLLEFFFLTPLPGSEDHKKLLEKGVWMDPDLNKYDLNHACTGHPLMSKAEWEEAYRTAWETYYSDDHVERVLRRAAATKTSVGKTLFVLNWFVGSIRIEKIHPLEAGFVRLKYRRDRRSGFPIEPALTFYPRFIAETIAKQVRWAWLWGRTRRLYKSIRFGKGRYEYTDESLTPVLDDEVETHAMFDTVEAKAFVAQQKRIAAATTTGEAA